MDSIKRFFLSVVVKKMTMSAAKLIATFAVTHGLTLAASYGGYKLDIQDQAGIAVLINTGLKGLLHTLSHKFPNLSWISPHDEVVPVDGMPSGPMPELCATVLPEPPKLV